MKTLRLIDRGQYKAKTVLAQVLGAAGVDGITVEQMRRRVKLMDAIDAAGDTLSLEDADFELLKTTIERFPFGLAHHDLLAVLEAATAPVEPPPG